MYSLGLIAFSLCMALLGVFQAMLFTNIRLETHFFLRFNGSFRLGYAFGKVGQLLNVLAPSDNPSITPTLPSSSMEDLPSLASTYAAKTFLTATSTALDPSFPNQATVTKTIAVYTYLAMLSSPPEPRVTQDSVAPPEDITVTGKHFCPSVFAFLWKVVEYGSALFVFGVVLLAAAGLWAACIALDAKVKHALRQIDEKDRQWHESTNEYRQRLSNSKQSLDSSVEQAAKTRRELKRAVYHVKESAMPFPSKRQFLATELAAHREELLAVRNEEIMALKRNVRETLADEVKEIQLEARKTAMEEIAKKKRVVRKTVHALHEKRRHLKVMERDLKGLEDLRLKISNIQWELLYDTYARRARLQSYFQEVKGDIEDAKRRKLDELGEIGKALHTGSRNEVEKSCIQLRDMASDGVGHHRLDALSGLKGDIRKFSVALRIARSVLGKAANAHLRGRPAIRKGGINRQCGPRKVQVSCTISLNFHIMCWKKTRVNVLIIRMFVRLARNGES